MKKAPALPLFGDAYLADTRHLTLEEHGAYLHLLLIAWRTDDCALPDDDKRLAQMLGVSAAKWRKLKPSIMAFWALENGRWSQHRLTKERKFVDEKRAKNSASANARWNGQVSENKENDEYERISERISDRNAPPPSPSLIHSTSDVEDNHKGSSSGADAPKSSYAFLGRTIRLKPNDLARWRRTYHTIKDFDAELATLDAWWEGQTPEKRKAWFHATAGMLNRKHQENMTAKTYDKDRITV